MIRADKVVKAFSELSEEDKIDILTELIEFFDDADFFDFLAGLWEPEDTFVHDCLKKIVNHLRLPDHG